jgi:hypothetical protein
MSTAATRRALLESVQTLVKASQPNEQQIVQVFVSLGSVLSDLTGEKVLVNLKVVGQADAPTNKPEDA